MGTYTRLGSYLLASELANDPFGSVHRAVVISGANFDRHVLVRSFSEELFQAGLNTRLNEVSRVVPLLGGARIFGLGYRIEGGKAPHVAWDHVPGRSLAQLIEKAKQEQIPFGVDHALTVIQGVAQGVVQMHAKGVSHGVLSPHSVWVSFEGATQIIDAPFAALVKSLLSKAPGTQQKLAPYLQGAGDALQLDLFSLGAILFELLTFERLPLGGDLQSVLDRATLKAAQEDGPIPAEIRALLGRMLLGRQPFATPEAFNAELERVLYDGEYSPTTFNMAFFMHTLFREENDRDATAMKAEQGSNYLAYTAAGDSLRSGATRVEHLDGHNEAQAKDKNTTMLIGGGIAAVVILGLGYIFFGRAKVDPAVQKQLAELQLLKVQIEQQKSDLDAKSKAESENTVKLQKQLNETKSVEEKIKLQKQLEESQQRKLDLERQQKEAEQKLAEQRTASQKAEQKMAEQKQSALMKAVAPVPTPPVQQAPVPTPMPAQTQSAVSQPSQSVPEAPKEVQQVPSAPVQAAPSAPAVMEPAAVVSQVAPSFPTRAIQMRWQLNLVHVVRLKVFVGEQGQPLKVQVIEGIPGTFGFDEAAIEAANRSTYRPATKDGKPVKGWTNEFRYVFPKR